MMIPAFKRKIILSVILAFALNSCAPEQKPINFGHDHCSSCKMIISDMRYGAELVTKKGKIYKYDSAECLAHFCNRTIIEESEVHSIWVINFEKPGQFINANDAVYLQSNEFHSPMGLNISAFASENSAKSILKSYPGALMNWDSVRKFVNSKWSNK
jgi:copper chaperone NosL